MMKTINFIQILFLEEGNRDIPRIQKNFHISYCDNLVIEDGGETASKQDMDKSAYVRHNMPHHKSRLKVTEHQLNTFGDYVSPHRNVRAQKECDGMRFLIEWNADDIGVTQVEIGDHIFSSLDKFVVDTSIKFSLQTKPGATHGCRQAS
ncbi:hypothetical protein Tco_0847682 [Tanacetum coccineum]